MQQLYDQIEKHLKTCDSSNTPVICTNLENDSARKCIVQTVAEFCMKKKLEISQAIIEVEKTYSINSND